MIGSGRDGKGESVGHWEWMRIERAKDGTLTFYGSPKGDARRVQGHRERREVDHLRKCLQRFPAARALHADPRGLMRKSR